MYSPNLEGKAALIYSQIMYLGALILLYRNLLVASAETHLTEGVAWQLDLSVDDAQMYRDECALAAQQIARLLSLLSFDGTLTKRCWLIMCVFSLK
jgi:hypothetical protein